MDKMRQTKKQPATLDELRARVHGGRYAVRPDRVAEAMIKRGVVFARRGIQPRP